MKQKSEIYDIFKQLYEVSFNKTGNRIIKLRSDNAKEYLSGQFWAFIDEKGIRHETTTPYSPKKNSIAERDNRNIVESARSMLYNKGVPLLF